SALGFRGPAARGESSPRNAPALECLCLDEDLLVRRGSHAQPLTREPNRCFSRSLVKYVVVLRRNELLARKESFEDVVDGPAEVLADGLADVGADAERRRNCSYPSRLCG